MKHKGKREWRTHVITRQARHFYQFAAPANARPRRNRLVDSRLDLPVENSTMHAPRRYPKRNVCFSVRKCQWHVQHRDADSASSRSKSRAGKVTFSPNVVAASNRIGNHSFSLINWHDVRTSPDTRRPAIVCCLDSEIVSIDDGFVSLSSIIEAVLKNIHCNVVGRSIYRN